ncbi:MAG: hypothetical protein QF578_20395 [Alphaproteobacteria bacterium]|nr:hypothetical protein [Alphaproteobacteria bacterium]
MNPIMCPPGPGNPRPSGIVGPPTIIMGPRPNLVINGGMTVSQRGTSFTTLAATQYTLDRWELEFSDSPDGRVTVSQDDGVPTGSGLSKSLKIECTTAEAAVGASEAIVLKTTLEAQDLQHLMYGDAATAQTTSLSFWIKSPKSGKHCVALYMDDGAVHYIQEFMVTTADEWEGQNIIFPGYAGSAIADDNGAGLTISFPLVAGTDYQADKEIWATGNDYATSEQQNLLDSTANNFFVAGVKFEVGDFATDFEHRRHADVLIQCKRYYQRLEVGTNGDILAIGQCESTSQVDFVVGGGFQAGMRTTLPTLTYSALGDFYMKNGTSSITPNELVVVGGDGQSNNIFTVVSTGNSSLTAGQCRTLAVDNTSSECWLAMDSEF